MSEPAGPEMESVEAFGEYLLDNDRTAFTFDEAEALSGALGLSVATPVIRALKAYGFEQEAREPEKRVRGFLTSSHDRFYGPGAAKMHGGSGWEQISGLAGQEG